MNQSLIFFSEHSYPEEIRNALRKGERTLTYGEPSRANFGEQTFRQDCAVGMLDMGTAYDLPSHPTTVTSTQSIVITNSLSCDSNQNKNSVCEKHQLVLQYPTSFFLS